MTGGIMNPVPINQLETRSAFLEYIRQIIGNAPVVELVYKVLEKFSIVGVDVDTGQQGSHLKSQILPVFHGVPLGLKSKRSLTSAAIFSSAMTPVPSVLIVILIGLATPIA